MAAFVLLPKRSVVERSLAWATRCIRLVRDYERCAETRAGFHVLTAAAEVTKPSGAAEAVVAKSMLRSRAVAARMVANLVMVVPVSSLGQKSERAKENVWGVDNESDVSDSQNVSEEEWSLVASYLTPMDEGAPQRQHSLRERSNGLRYIIRYGIGWRAMPNNLSAWSTCIIIDMVARTVVAYPWTAARAVCHRAPCVQYSRAAACRAEAFGRAVIPSHD